MKSSVKSGDGYRNLSNIVKRIKFNTNSNSTIKIEELLKTNKKVKESTRNLDNLVKDKYESPRDVVYNKESFRNNFRNPEKDSLTSITKLMTTVDSKNSLGTTQTKIVTASSSAKTTRSPIAVKFANDFFNKTTIENINQAPDSSRSAFNSMKEKDFLKLSNKLGNFEKIEEINQTSETDRPRTNIPQKLKNELKHNFNKRRFRIRKNSDLIKNYSESLNFFDLSSDNKDRDLNKLSSIKNFNSKKEIRKVSKLVPSLQLKNINEKHNVFFDKIINNPNLNRNNFVKNNLNNLKNDNRVLSSSDLIENKLTFRGIPAFNSIQILNNFLICDFLVGETNHRVMNSKFKMNLTDKIFKDLEIKKKKKMKKDQEEFELMKYGTVIKDQSEDDFKKIENIDFNKADLNTCKTILDKLKEKRKGRIEERSKKLPELIRDISTSYDESDPDIDAYFYGVKNINRVIRVRNILLNKADNKSDMLVISNLKKFKDEKHKIENELTMKKETLGLPSFVKTRFKKQTEVKYKMVSGKYFGVNV